jgi:hypothetical protein
MHLGRWECGEDGVPPADTHARGAVGLRWRRLGGVRYPVRVRCTMLLLS